MVAVNSGYVDREILKQALFLSTDEWDAYLDLLIGAASNIIERYTGRKFLASSPGETRYYDSRNLRSLHIDDVFSVSSVKLDTSGGGNFAVQLTEGLDYDLYPLNSLPKNAIRLRAEGRNPQFPAGQRTVAIEGSWGWPFLPESVKQAALLTASRWFKRRDVGYNETLGSPLLDSDVEAMLTPFKLTRRPVIEVLYP